MKAADIITVASANQIELWVESSSLKFRAPKGALTPELQKLFRDNRDSLIAELTKPAQAVKARIPLSCNQQSLWFLHQMAPESPAYNVAAACQVLSPVNADAVKFALKSLVSRHPILRTTYTLSEESKTVFQEVHSTKDIAFEHIDAAAWDDIELNKRVIASYKKPFDLTAGPVLRFQIFSRNNNNHLFLITLHHIACDAHSIHILLEDFISFYEAGPGKTAVHPEPVSCKYTDYISHQAEMLRGPQGARLLNYWKKKLHEAPASLDMPLDHKRPSVQSHNGSSVCFNIEGTQYDKVKECAKTCNTTVYALLLSVFQLLLSRMSGQKDICIGTPVACRTRKEYQNVCGYFVNPVVIRTRVDLSMTFREYLGHTSKTVFESLDYQEYPFALLVENLEISRQPGTAPVFQVMFNMLKRRMLGAAADFLCPSNSNSPVAFGPLKILPYPVHQQEGQYDMTLEIIDTEKYLFSVLKYCTDIFTSETAYRIVSDYRLILSRILEHPDEKVSVFVSQSDNFKTSPPPVKKTLAIAATFTAEPVAPALSFWTEKLAINTEIVFSRYSQVFQQLLDPAGIFSKNSNGINIILVRLDDWMQTRSSEPGSAECISEAGIKSIGHNAHEFLHAVESASKKMTAPLLILFCPPSPERMLVKAYQSAVSRIENELCRDLSSINGVFPVPGSEILETCPVDEYYEPLGEKIGHIPYTDQFFVSAATLIARKAFTVFSEPCKAIVLDCDQTLWSGVVAEDGALGVTVDRDRRWFQKFILSQHNAGRLICICSKNNAADVHEVFDTHPDMILKRSHLAAAKINWSHKSVNLRALSKELNIGLDSIIFIDDSPLECAEVEAGCPGVFTVQMPESDVDIKKFFKNLWIFDHLKITREDTIRSEYYKNSQERKQFLNETLSFADFINRLELDIRISELQKSDIPRVSQLTLRTNQFNLRTIRRNENQIESLCRQESIVSRVVNVRDRFGDYGLVGVIIAEKKSGHLDVDTFLLSCRALGRGVEHCMLAHIGKIALQENLDQVCLHYRTTERNQPVRNFLDEVAQNFKTTKHDGLLYEIPSPAAEKTVFRPKESAPDTAAPESKDPAYNAGSRDSDRTSRRAFMIEIATSLFDVKRIQSRITLETSNLKNCHKKTAGSVPGRVLQNKTESRIAEVWKKYLNLDLISADASFFDLGGHSTLIPQIVIDLIKIFNTDITIVDMFQYPTITALARHINNNAAPSPDKEKEKVRMQKSAINRQKLRTVMLRARMQRKQL